MLRFPNYKYVWAVLYGYFSTQDLYELGDLSVQYDESHHLHIAPFPTILCAILVDAGFALSNQVNQLYNATKYTI